MATVAIISQKGGCGKSTLATNIAAYFASQRVPITLGDLDHQQSMRVWLNRRPADAPAIASWAADASALWRPPAGTTHVVVDTPGGLHGFALAKVVMIADAILIPVSGSIFDRESVADCWAELRAHPRVKSGRCQVACIGMRLDGRTDAEQITRQWAASIELPWLGSLRSAQVYVRAIENGLSIFDMPSKITRADRAQWRPLIAWLEEQFAAVNQSSKKEKPVLKPLPPKPAPSAPTHAANVRPAAAAQHGAASAAPSHLIARAASTIQIKLAAFPQAPASKGLVGLVSGWFRKLQYR
ncbi:MAG: ParA family protein [Burkholderiaceae bacterium]